MGDGDQVNRGGEQDQAESQTPRLSRADIAAIATSVAEILRREGRSSPVTMAGSQSSANEQGMVGVA